MKLDVSSETLAQIKTWLGTGSINIFGLPFSGKDTQSKRLAELLNGVIIGGGEIIRNGDDETLKKQVADGSLAPTDAYLKTVLPYLSKPEFDGKPLILSSVGRWQGEEEVILQATKESGHPTKAVILLKTSEDDLRHRHKQIEAKADRETRDDDAEEHLERRINEFNTKTKPVIKSYKEQGLLLEIDGTQPPENVTTSILEALISHV